MEKSMKNRPLKSRKTVDRDHVRCLIANYMQSEGCGCCQDDDNHKIDKQALAELLNVAKYRDGSGYSFRKFIKRKE